MKRGMRTAAIVMSMAACAIAVSAGTACARQISIAIIDSGARGYVDEAISFTSFPADRDPLDHGTQVARIIREDNPTARIVMLQVCEHRRRDLQPSVYAVLQAIRWCVENRIDIVNMSLVVKHDPRIDDAITEAATSHGIVFIAAAGNRSVASRFAADEDGFIRRSSKVVKPSFPASNPHVISVGALDKYGRVASYSGAACDVYAQGHGGGQDGTSFASARITARAARMRVSIDEPSLQNILSALK